MDTQAWDRLVAVEPLIRRVLCNRVDPSSVDDLVQETLERISGRVEDLTADQLAGYAAKSALNAAASFHRTNARHRRLQPGLVDLSGPDGVDTQVVAIEEATTLRSALGALDPVDRELLEAHHVDEASVASLARQTGRSEMAVRLSLARARAKLRVDYTLAHQRVDPPTRRCRPVLLALSSGDRRAQQRLDADDHLEHCRVCSELVAPATGRQRPAVGIFALLAWWWKGISAAGRRWLTICAASTGAAAVAVITMLAMSRPAPPSEPVALSRPAPPSEPVASAPTAAPTTASGRVRTEGGPLPSSADGLQATTGQRVTATSAPVLEVPADEGFWIQADDGGTIWVWLVDTGPESPIEVRPASTVTFTGTVVAHQPGFTAQFGLTGPAAERLSAQGQHLEVRAADIEIG